MMIFLDCLGGFDIIMGLPRWLSGKESACQNRRLGFDPCVRKIPWKRKWQPTPVFLLGKIPRTEEPGMLELQRFKGLQRFKKFLKRRTQEELESGHQIR